MSDLESTNFSTTAASNNASPPDGAPEGWAPSSVNNWGREFMAAVKRQWNRAGPTVTSGGSANAHTLTYGAAVAALVQGQTYAFIAGFTNTGATTLAVSGLTAKAIRLNNAALAGGEIVAGSTYVVMYDGTAYQLVSLPSTLAPSSIPNRNFLINPGLEVWQRGAQGAASFSIVANNQTTVADKWTFKNIGNAMTISQQAGLTSQSRWSCKVLRNAAETAVNHDFLEQWLTLDQIMPLRGKFVTLSCYMLCGANYSSTTNNILMSIYTGVGSAGVKSSSSYTTQTIPASTTFSLTTSAVQYSISSAAVIPTNTTQLCVQWERTPAGTAGSDDSWTIDDVKLEIGGAASVFDRQSFAADLVDCQFFYAKSFPIGTAPAQSGGVTGALTVFSGTGLTGTEGLTWQYPRRMYKVPTITTYNPSAGNANWRDVTNSADRTVTVGTVSDMSVPISLASGAAASTNQIHAQADADS